MCKSKLRIIVLHKFYFVLLFLGFFQPLEARNSKNETINLKYVYEISNVSTKCKNRFINAKTLKVKGLTCYQDIFKFFAVIRR